MSQLDKDNKNLEAIVSDIKELTKTTVSPTSTTARPAAAKKVRPVPRQIADAARSRTFTMERTHPLIPYIISMREILDKVRPNKLETWTRACAGPYWAAINKPELTNNLSPDRFCKAMIDLYFLQGSTLQCTTPATNGSSSGHRRCHLPGPLKSALSYCIAKSGPEVPAKAERATAIHYIPETAPCRSNNRERRGMGQEEAEPQQERIPTRIPQKSGRRPTCTKCRTLAESHPSLNINFTLEESAYNGPTKRESSPCSTPTKKKAQKKQSPSVETWTFMPSSWSLQLLIQRSQPVLAVYTSENTRFNTIKTTEVTLEDVDEDKLDYNDNTEFEY
ncbi:hypothetical protein BDR26DRAFT_1003531 [Obelidium mucronatum]|nr:hypothetical protein BDR26DRAFT_1003531 [Obelidium mucronatum]